MKWPSENQNQNLCGFLYSKKYVKVGKTLQGQSIKHKSQISEEWHVMANVGHIYVSISILQYIVYNIYLDNLHYTKIDKVQAQKYLFLCGKTVKTYCRNRCGDFLALAITWNKKCCSDSFNLATYIENQVPPRLILITKKFVKIKYNFFLTRHNGKSRENKVQFFFTRHLGSFYYY